MRALLTCLITTVFCIGSVSSEQLLPVELEELRSRLKDLKENEPRLQNRFNAAARALTKATSNETAAVALYVSSVETFHFEEMHRKQGDFRKWKNQHDNLLSDKAFRRALMHRFQWMALTLKASRLSGDDFSTLSLEVEKAVKHFADDAPQIARLFARGGNNPLIKDLKSNVLKGVVAKRFGVETVKLDSAWPRTILPFEKVYESIVFPSLRKDKGFEALGAAWDRLIFAEKAYTEGVAFGDEKKRGPKGSIDRFKARRVPELLWKKEIDLFKAGDQRTGATRMLKFLEENITSPDAAKWIDEFNALLEAPKG